MSFRKLGLLCVFVLVLGLSSPAAHAQQCCTPEEPDYYSWDFSSGGTYNPPTTTKCEARASSNQTCRTCTRAYDDNGMWKGYYVCAYVKFNAACSCDGAVSPNCDNKGSCTYLN
jgi:hypothetical protein